MHYFFIGQCSAAAAAKSLQLCLTLCDPIDGSPSGSPVPGILQARTLEWVAISFSNAWKWKVKVNLLSRVWLLATPWTAAHQAPLSMGFARQEYWSGVPLPSPGQCYRHMFIFPKTPFRTQAMMVSSFFFFQWPISCHSHWFTLVFHLYNFLCIGFHKDSTNICQLPLKVIINLLVRLCQLLPC